MEDLVYEGKVIRGYAGISIQDITPSLQKALNLSSTQGAIVADVVAQQPAAKAGIKTGDIIISVSEKPVQGANQLRNLVAFIRPGTKVPIKLLRNGKQIQLTLVTIERTPDLLKQQSMQQRPRPRRGNVDNKLGIGVTDLTSDLRNRFRIPQEISGVVVIKISPEIFDERTLLSPGDLIIQAKESGGKWTPFGSTSDFQKYASSIKNDQAVALQIFKNDQTAFISFEIGQ